MSRHQGPNRKAPPGSPPPEHKRHPCKRPSQTRQENTPPQQERLNRRNYDKLIDNEDLLPEILGLLDSFAILTHFKTSHRTKAWQEKITFHSNPLIQTFENVRIWCAALDKNSLTTPKVQDTAKLFARCIYMSSQPKQLPILRDLTIPQRIEEALLEVSDLLGIKNRVIERFKEIGKKGLQTQQNCRQSYRRDRRTQNPTISLFS